MAVILSLRNIVEMVHSPVFTNTTVGHLQTYLKELKIIFKKAFPDSRFKPKHHFSEHYPDQIRLLGPLVHVSTIRFEAKHNFFKRIIRGISNFKSILATLARRYQLMEAYHLASPHFLGQSVVVKNVTGIHATLLSEDIQKVLPDMLPSSIILVSDTVVIEGTKYSNGMFGLVASATLGLAQFAEI
ncbi:hypothetical protein HOLleu_22619 [Holothuria leucospilota]|uniref:Uncharacterized protein n=1 Tax=Holothuria leucospilota TaxID=206669 RepID=A0A9Q1BYQ0_HOLLE|nr:hypothetical protein HOLleu_22619 [Holothuria leucospilota]